VTLLDIFSFIYLVYAPLLSWSGVLTLQHGPEKWLGISGPALTFKFILPWVFYGFPNKLVLLETKKYPVLKSTCAENLTAVGEYKKSTFN